MSQDSFGAAGELRVGEKTYRIFRLGALGDVSRLPYVLKVLLENMLRHEDGSSVHPDDISALARWDGTPPDDLDLAFRPARVLMQDFTGVPAVVDLAVMRDAVRELGGDPSRIDPLVPVELVIDHSVIAEVSGRADAFRINADIELSRNRERYALLRWAQQAFGNFVVVPPDTGICHQVNLEYLSRVVFTDDQGVAYPDTLVGMDSHTPMVNGLGVLGWGVGGIEAEAAMLGQPFVMPAAPVVGVRLTGTLPDGSTATDLVLAIAELLRHHGVVDKFVEFWGPGVGAVPLETRATIGNMSPEYGSTCTIFPIDDETLRYLRFTGRSEEQVALVEAYAKEQGLFHRPEDEPIYTEYVDLDLATVEPSIAGPARPQDRVALGDAPSAFRQALESTPGSPGSDSGQGRRATARLEDGSEVELGDGAVVIAAITSCTNTSNPDVMIAAGLLARNAVARGLSAKPWVKTSLAPGSMVVTDYLKVAGLDAPLDQLGFELVGYGCTTCIGNSGPLLDGVTEAVNAGDLSVSAVLSGNRNFEGRIHPEVRMNWLASPPLVVAYALAGTMEVNLATDPLGTDPDGNPVHLSDIWPTTEETARVVRESVGAEMFRSNYANIYRPEAWGDLEVPSGPAYAWDPESTYVSHAPFLDNMTPDPEPIGDISGARALAVMGDSVTTDHISPAGNIATSSPAGRWLIEHGVPREDFNSYGARRGNHEVLLRGTFANVRFRNRLVPDTEGSSTLHLPDGEQMTMYDAAMRYEEEQVPLILLAGKEYGTGSSRDWAAKGPRLMGVRAVIAETYERIHRSNLIGMGILPLQFQPGESVESLGLTGHEVFDIEGLEPLERGEIPKQATVTADGRSFSVRVRINTPQELDYYRHGGILPFVVREQLRQTAGA